jgi:microcystin-dependent protein
MAEPFLGEIRTFAFTYPPAGWALCDGRVMSVKQNPALASLLGSRYGGDGVNTFGLPDLQGRVPRHKSASDDYGQKFGEESVALTPENLPKHSHELKVKDADSTTNVPAGNVLGLAAIYAEPKNLKPMYEHSLELWDKDAHNNLQPSLVLNYCIALQGTFPPRP